MSAKPPKSPPTVRERTRNFLLYGFAISILLHLLAGPLLKFQRAPDAPEKIETVKIDKMPTPPPTPKPTPKPTPTPPPTPPPKVEKQTPQPAKPQQIKINTAHQNSHAGGESEEGNTHTSGSTNGVPGGSATGAPTSVPVVATPAPPPPPTPTPPACARPEVPAHTINASSPDTPALAQQQGISGEVRVSVQLDENSKLVSAQAQSGPAILRSAAEKAARASTFQTTIHECKPIAGTYIFIVEFNSQ